MFSKILLNLNNILLRPLLSFNDIILNKLGNIILINGIKKEIAKLDDTSKRR